MSNVTDGSIVQCDKCGAHGRRAAGCAAPDFWFYIESEDKTPGRKRGHVYIVYACSEACRDSLWQTGSGRGTIDEAGSLRERTKTAEELSCGCQPGSHPPLRNLLEGAADRDGRVCSLGWSVRP